MVISKCCNLPLKILFCCFLLLLNYSCPNFTPIALPTLPNPHPPTFIPPTPHSHSQSPPHCPCPWVLYICSLTCSFPFFPPLYPSSFALVTVSLFFISMSLVLFCPLVCFVDYVPLIGEIIWYLSFYFILLFFKNYFIVVQLQLSAFSPHPST